MGTAVRAAPGGSRPLEGPPRLTVAVPLYRSARFLDVIRANLDVLLEVPEVEVLISDRHGLDDALDRLRDACGGDGRVRFLESRDGVGWIAHYNLLLEEARGELFAWMPHDDDFPRGWYTGLAAHLERHPETILAYGPVVGTDERGRRLGQLRKYLTAPPWEGDPRVLARGEAYRMLAWGGWVPFRGVFRRAPVLERGVRLPSTLGGQGADKVFVLELGLLGRVRWVDVPACTKRHYPESTHRREMPFTLRSRASQYTACARAVLRHESGVAARVVGLRRLGGIFWGQELRPRLRARARRLIRSLLRRGTGG